MKSILTILKWPVNRFRRLQPRGKFFTTAILILLVFWRINVYRNSGLEVQLTKVEKGNLAEVVSASGEITAANSASLAFRTPGEVTEVNFQVGDQVKKGDVIAKLDTILLYATYQQADATLRAAQAALNYTHDTLQGKETSESFSEISTRTAAETTKDKAYWAYVIALENLEGAYIKAPFDGILTFVPDNIVPGAYVSLPSGAPFQVISPESTYFEAEVSEVDIHKLTSGAVANVEIDAFENEIFEGIVSGFNFTSTLTSTGGTAYKVTIMIPENKDLMFKPGMNGDAEIILSRTENTLLIPITALIEDQDKSYVWINSGRKAKKVEVQIGKSSIDEVEIVSGIEEGLEIITRPPSKIEEGMRLKITNS